MTRGCTLWWIGGLATAVSCLAILPASAQLVCTPSPYVSGSLSCTNSGAINAAVSVQAITPGDASFSNSGTVNGFAFVEAQAGGNTSLSNSGTINGNAIADVPLAFGTATATNTGSVIGGSLIAQTNSGGAASATNFGSISGGGLNASTSQGGNTTAINYGTIDQPAGIAIASTPDGGGTAVAINRGQVTSSVIGIYTNVNSPGGDTVIDNSGTIVASQYGVLAYASSSSTIPGTINITNSGSIVSAGEGIQTLASIANVVVTNSGNIAAAQYGIAADSSSGDVTVTNRGTVQGDPAAILASSNTGNVTVVNYGTASGAQRGLLVDSSAASATAVNYGTVTGADTGIFTTIGNSSGTATTRNFGTVTGGQYGILTAASQGSAVTQNAGFVSGGLYGIYTRAANGSSSVENTGLVLGAGTGSTAIFTSAFNGGTSTLVNSGRVLNFGGDAIQFSGGPDTLILSPGSFIVGAIELVGTNDTVKVNAGNQNLTFNTLAGASIGGAVPFVVFGNRIATVDTTLFATSDRTLLAFTGAITAMLGGRTTDTAPAMRGSGGGALGFAGPDTTVSTIDDAFAQVLGYAKASQEAVLFKNPTQVLEDGTTVWANGFYGQRIQQADGPVLRAVTNFYGGAIGIDGLAKADLRLGGLVGGGNISTSVDLNQGDAESEVAFIGAYGRQDLGRAFIDFALLGGHSSNHGNRNLNNNLLPNGLETASATFGGWFTSPEIAAGYRHDLAAGWSVSPAVRLRYLAAGYDGYTETGSTANLTVGSRILQAAEQRADLTFTNTVLSDGGRMRFGLTIGALGQQRIGTGNINTILLGQALAFATPGKASVSGGYGALSLDWRLPKGVGLFAGVEYTALTDSSSTVTGRGGVRISF